MEGDIQYGHDGYGSLSSSGSGRVMSTRLRLSGVVGWFLD